MNTSGQDQALAHLLRGEAPGPGAILDGITVGLESLTDFLSDQYLREFIPLGGSKIKFATGRPGCGKTHFSQVIFLDGFVCAKHRLVVFLFVCIHINSQFRKVHIHPRHRRVRRANP